MTVEELIAALHAMSPTAPVIIWVEDIDGIFEGDTLESIRYELGTVEITVSCVNLGEGH